MKHNIYLGFDPREEIAYEVAKKSILRRTSQPQRTSIFPIKLSNPEIKKILTRPLERRENQLWCPISNAPCATEFAISRFCIPFLQHKGWALFCDSDVLCQSDIKELFDLRDEKYAIQVVKHNYQPVEAVKMDGQIQTSYSRKNWSSVILWNCSHPSNKNLTLEVLNTWPGRDLHAFKWLKDEEIGELPQEWNFLVGVTDGNGENAKMLHYTNGGPWFGDWKGGDYDELWLREREVVSNP